MTLILTIPNVSEICFLCREIGPGSDHPETGRPRACVVQSPGKEFAHQARRRKQGLQKKPYEAEER